MRHRVEVKDLDGHKVESEIASTTGGNYPSKSLSAIVRIGEETEITYRVHNRDLRLHFDYDNLADAIQAYNWI